MILVMNEYAVSVSCRRSRSGDTICWLTRESGRRPLCLDADGCGCSGAEYNADELRASYMIVLGQEGRDDQISAFAQLSVESLEAALFGGVQHRCDTPLYLSCRGGCFCIECAHKNPEGRRLFEMISFYGMCGSPHWFKGVSDGAEVVAPLYDSDRRTWLQCASA